MAEIAQQLARAWGDQSERGRMQSDLTVKFAEPPRGLGIMSGEEVPDIGESGIARFLRDRYSPPAMYLSHQHLQLCRIKPAVVP